MSKSAIYTSMTTPTDVAVNGTIPLGTTIRRFGCNVAQDSNSVTISGRGYFKVSASITLAPTATTATTVTLLKDGVPVSGATATVTVPTANDTVAVPIEAIVRNRCDCDSSILSLQLTGTAASVTNVAFVVEKL